MLAIIIPYFKISFFEATLQSLADQTDKRFKVYIGDDASLANPEKLLEKYRDKFDFVYHRFQNNLGSISLTRQWERCIELTDNQDWIMILGDDDALGENVIETFYQNLEEIEKAKSNVVRFSTQIIDNINNKFFEIFTHPKLEKTADSYYRKFLRLSRSSLSEYIFKKQIYIKYKFKNYPLAWHSDDYAWLEFSENFLIYSINDAVISINVSAESLTGNVNNLIEKNKAEIAFYIDIITYQLKKFKKYQIARIVVQAEIALKEYNKITLSEWKMLSKVYIDNFLIFSFLKFIRRFVKSYFN